MAKREKAKFRVGQVVFDYENLCYGLLATRPIKGIWTIVCVRGIPNRREYHAPEEQLRALTKKEFGAERR